MIDPHATLADLVTANPARARALEALGLDYCCHGARPLTDAAAEAGREMSMVVAVLDAIDASGGPGGEDWARLGIADLLDHIVQVHHDPLRSDVPRLVALGRKVQSVHGERHPELAGIVTDLEQVWAQLEPHLDDEETTQFPQIKAAVAGRDVDVDLAGLLAEHEVVGTLLDRLRDQSGVFQPPADGCASFQAFYAGLAALDADTRLHIHKENNVVFPAVREHAAATTP